MNACRTRRDRDRCRVSTRRRDVRIAGSIGHGLAGAARRGEQEFARLLVCGANVVIDRLPGLFSDLEPDWQASLFLAHCRALDGVAVGGDVLDLEGDDIAAAQLAVDCQIEHRQVAFAVCDSVARNPQPHRGSKFKQFGSNPKGTNVFDANGRFFVMIQSADNSKIASQDPSSSETNSDEAGCLIVESIAYCGTYTVNETERVAALHLEASTFPNENGTDQKRTITSLAANELKYSYPAAISGVQVHQVWMRATAVVTN